MKWYRWTILKFSISSIAAAVLDFVLLFVFKHVTGDLFFSVMMARGASSVCNYCANRFIVFEAENLPTSQSAPRYFALVVVIALMNYALLKLFIDAFGINDVLAKLITEIMLFVLSFTLQRAMVFAKGKTE